VGAYASWIVCRSGIEGPILTRVECAGLILWLTVFWFGCDLLPLHACVCHASCRADYARGLCLDARPVTTCVLLLNMYGNRGYELDGRVSAVKG